MGGCQSRFTPGTHQLSPLQCANDFSGTAVGGGGDIKRLLIAHFFYPIPMFFSAARKQFIPSAPSDNALKPSRPHRLKRFVAQGAVGAALLATWAAAPAQALTWNWSFTGDLTSGQGTFMTAGTTAQAGITETITAITGTYTRSGTGGADGIFQITGLDNSIFGGGQIFQWDGTNTSQIISNNSGIEFVTDGGTVLIGFDGAPGLFSSLNATASIFNGLDGSIFSSTLSPVLVSSPAPSPLPLLGAASAFGWSRQLRRRIKTSV